MPRDDRIDVEAAVKETVFDIALIVVLWILLVVAVGGMR